MTSLDDEDNKDEEFNASLKAFPSTFSLERSKLKLNKLKYLQLSLRKELDTNEDELDDIIQKLNLLTWVEFKLGEIQLSMKANDEVIKLTNDDNLTSLSNKAYLMWMTGDELQARECLEKLVEMKNRDDFESLWTSAEADQAYCYGRLGGARNLQRAIDMYSKVTNKKPEMYLWKFSLGLSYRRGIHVNIYASCPQTRSVKDYVEKAAALLFEVGEKSDNNNLKARAYAELAGAHRDARQTMNKEECDQIFSKKTYTDFCSEALKYGDKNTCVLTTCGRLLRCPDVKKATSLLEKAVQMRKSGTAYHHLGLCYETQAREAQDHGVHDPVQTSNNDAVQRSMSLNEVGVINLVRSRVQEVPIEKDDELVKKAVKCLQEAISISCDLNFPAMYSLGVLLKSCGQLEEALVQFNKITNSPNLDDGHRFTVISAYEQAGLCLLELHKKTTSTSGPTEKADILQTEAEKKLTKAVGLAADLAATVPDLKDHAKTVWNSFRTLESRLESKEPSPAVGKKLIKLLGLVRDHGKILSVVQKLLATSEAEIDDPGVVKSSLESYLALEEYENALAFLNMVYTRPVVADGKSTFWKKDSLVMKVYLSVAASRIKSRSGDAKFIFKDLFDSESSNNLNVNKDLEDSDGSRAKDKGNMSNDKAVCEVRDKEPTTDVLIVFDDSHDTEEEQSSITTTACCLQTALSNVFGLDACQNLQGCCSGGVELSLQLDEMCRSKVVILLLGREEQSRYFKGLLKFVPSLWVESSDSSMPKVLVAVTDDTVEVESPLNHLEKICLKNILDDFDLPVTKHTSNISTTPLPAAFAKKRAVSCTLEASATLAGVTDRDTKESTPNISTNPAQSTSELASSHSSPGDIHMGTNIKNTVLEASTSVTVTNPSSEASSNMSPTEDIGLGTGPLTSTTDACATATNPSSSALTPSTTVAAPDVKGLDFENAAHGSSTCATTTAITTSNDTTFATTIVSDGSSNTVAVTTTNTTTSTSTAPTKPQFDSHVNALMTLFCFLIGKQWSI